MKLTIILIFRPGAQNYQVGSIAGGVVAYVDTTGVDRKVRVGDFITESEAEGLASRYSVTTKTPSKT